MLELEDSILRTLLLQLFDDVVELSMLKVFLVLQCHFLNRTAVINLIAVRLGLFIVERVIIIGRINRVDVW